jgi:hypothetical protein
MQELNQLRMLIGPGLYYIYLACRLNPAWQMTLTAEGFNVEWLAPDSESTPLARVEEEYTALLFHAQDQGELLALLFFLHGFGISLRSVAYVGAVTTANLLSEA